MFSLESTGKIQCLLVSRQFAPASAIKRLIKRLIKNALHKYYNSDDYPISAAANLFVNVINIRLFEDGNERICCLIWLMF